MPETGDSTDCKALQGVRTYLRPVKEDDLPSLLGLVVALHAHHGYPAGATLDTLARDVMGDPPCMGDPPWLKTLVAEREGRLVGYAALCPAARMHFGLRGMYLHHLYVDPGLRGAGLGRRLIEACVEVAKDLGCAFMVVGTEPGNHKAQAVYVACGFEALPGDGSWFRRWLSRPAGA